MKYLGNKFTWYQILFWGGLWFIMPTLLTNWDDWERLLVRNTVAFAGILVIVFINLEYLLPRFYINKKFLVYGLCGLGLIVLIVALIDWDAAPWAKYYHWGGNRLRNAAESDTIRRPQPWRGMRYLSLAMPNFTSFLGSGLFYIAKYAAQKEKETVSLKAEKLESEIKFLKSQINPHFLFNALNNIYTLTILKDEKAPENLLKLSGMLRYMLYDCKADRVPLKKEVEYINNFIELNLLKNKQPLNVESDLKDYNPELLVAPLIFIPFIENAFKHSNIEDLKKGWIKISLHTADNQINFAVWNSVPKGVVTKDQEGGIGLQNVTRQLELIYPDKHEITINEEANQFRVSLKIDLT
jgi:two-component system, LytTR family, sensor kinase